jgi:hypothetical protein
MRRTLLLALALLAGCTAAPQATRNPLEIDAAEYRRLFDASLLVLRSQGFVVDRQDYRFGRITARPRGAPTLLEPWYPDNTTFGQALEGTLNAERRLVTVALDPAPPAGPAGKSEIRNQKSEGPSYLLRVEVQIERQQYPARQLSGSFGEDMLGSLAAAPGELRDRGITGPYWQPVGRDPYLEERLLAAIVRQSLALPVTPPPPGAPAWPPPGRPGIDVTKPPPTEGI